jgi:hypothetical protein
MMLAVAPATSRQARVIVHRERLQGNQREAEKTQESRG